MSSVSVSCSLAGPLTDASSVLSQSKVVEHVKSLVVLSMGLFAVAKKLKGWSFFKPNCKDRVSSFLGQALVQQVTLYVIMD